MVPNARAIVWRKARFSLVLACGIFAVTASAQINEQDRLNRCANNSARIIELQGQFSGIWNDEQVSRARLVMAKLVPQRDMLRQVQNSYLMRTGDPEGIRRYQDELADFEAVSANIKIRCRVRDFGCPDRTIALIEKEIGNAQAARPARLAAEREIAAHRTNLIALRCSDGSTATVATLPDLAGTWYREGRTSLPASIAENGGTLVFTNEMKPPMVSRGHFVSAGEVVADQWEGGLVGIVSPDLRHIAWRNGTNWSR